MWFNIYMVIVITGNMDFQGKHLEREKTMGRFKHMLSAAGAPWKGTDKCLQYIGWLIESKLMKVPYGWPSMINYFHKNEEKFLIFTRKNIVFFCLKNIAGSGVVVHRTWLWWCTMYIPVLFVFMDPHSKCLYSTLVFYHTYLLGMR